MAQFREPQLSEGAQARSVANRPAMTHQSAKLVFWGVRGSTPTLERDTWRYGGNTPCLEFTAPGGTHFILDCGTGLRMLGNHLQALSGRWSRWRGDGGIEAH